MNCLNFTFDENIIYRLTVKMLVGATEIKLCPVLVDLLSNTMAYSYSITDMRISCVYINEVTKDEGGMMKGSDKGPALYGLRVAISEGPCVL